MKLVYRVEVEAPAEMKPLFQLLVKDVTEEVLRQLARRMTGSGCRATLTKIS